jgi:DNA ligase (NAD+)
MIADAADLYDLEETSLAELDRLGEKSAANITGAIEVSKARSLARVLFALGIPHVGGETAELLVQRFGSVVALREASVEDIGETPGIGPIIAESVWRYFRDPRNLDLLARLEAAGVTMAAKSTGGSAQAGGAGLGPEHAGDHFVGPLAGKTLVLTGTLPTLSRDQATELIEAAGGRVTGSVSSRTDYLVVGENPGSKATKAGQLGVRQLDEGGLRALLEAS